MLPRLPDFVLNRSFGLSAAAVTFTLLTAVLVPFEAPERLLAFALAYLLVTLIASAIWGYLVGVVSAVAADLLVNFFFVPPVHTFTVQAPENVAALIVFLAVALVGSSMLALLRRQVLVAEAHRAETALLLDLTQQVAHARTPNVALSDLCRAVSHALHARSCSILRDDGGWKVLASTGSPILTPDERAMAQKAFETGQIVRYGEAATARPRLTRGEHPQALTFVPFPRETAVPGVLRIGGVLRVPSQVEFSRLLEAFANEAATATERARLAEEARRVEVLQRADDFKTAILSSVSHDLRSPLTAMKAAVGSLRDPALDWSEDDRGVLLETIESQTDRLTTTVNGLLQMSRLEGGAVEPHIETLDARQLLEDCVSLTKAATEGRTVDVRTPEPPPVVRGDYALLIQSLTNLIENAAKYSVPGGGIRLCAEKRDGVVALTVSDEGPGIPPQDLPHIFEKFYRGSQAKARGTGLGLSIVEAMVRISGGRVTVRSNPEGTTFTIELPAGGTLQ